MIESPRSPVPPGEALLEPKMTELGVTGDSR